MAITKIQHLCTTFFQKYYHDINVNHIEYGYHEDDDVDKIHQLILNELTDDGFSENEVEEILLSPEVGTNAAYKFIAYYFLIQEKYKTIEDLKALINKSDDCNIDDFTDYDLFVITKFSKQLDT